MAQPKFRKLVFYALLLIAVSLSESPRFLVECRSLQSSTIDLGESSTTQQSYTTEFNLATTDSSEGDIDLHQIPTIEPTTSETSREATANISDLDNLPQINSFVTSPDKNQSLYDELLKATSFHPTFSSFETSSEFLKFDNMNMNSNSDESKSDESSMEKKFNDDQLGFKANETKEVRHTIDEGSFDEQSVKYSSLNTKIINGTEDDDEKLRTTTSPQVLTTAKKGKYLDHNSQSDGNINATIPNAAEVWALAGMREVETRRPFESIEDELLGANLNDTIKNLLDWSEIAKMDKDTISKAESSEEGQKEDSNLTNSTITNNGHESDPAMSENKDIGVFVSLAPPAPTLTTLKPIIDDNRLELENGNVEFANLNKSQSRNTDSRIDAEVFSKSQEEREESAVELIDPLKKIDSKKMKESLRVDELEIKNDVSITESNENFTTESTELLETTTMENYETTTSIVDSFTVIGEDEESDEIFKRTITELPPLTTDQPAFVTTTQIPSTTTTISDKSQIETTTEMPAVFTTEVPESTLPPRSSSLVTKSISLRVVTTNNPAEPTISDFESFSTTLIPKFISRSSQTMATTQHYEEFGESSSSNPVEIIDDDKFKYSTWLPDTTTDVPNAFAKSGEMGGSSIKPSDTLEKESLDGDQSGGGGNLGLISAIASIVAILVLAGVVYFVMKRRNKQNFSQRCRPVGLDAYSLDNVSVYNSVRRKANAMRLSKRSYGNSAFEDPSLQSNVLDYQSLQDFTKNKSSIQNEFKEIPQVSVRVDEVPESCEDKNRYANVVPLPETRVHLQRLNDDEKTEYINANYVKGPKDSTNYYIATQAPLENTVPDFWRMVWEQNSKVIIMATDLTENGVERSAEYIPASVVLDNSQTFGDFQVTLKSREVKGKYAASQVHLKNLKTNTWREIMHLWYSWPENGCPTDESSIISLLLEARGYLRTNLPEHLDENSNTEINKDMNDKEKLSTLDKTKSLQRVQGPLTIHCSPGTGRTGTLIACDIILRMLETPPRKIDIPQIVYYVRRGRANAIRTKDQYEFIYNIANAYATKLNSAPTET